MKFRSTNIIAATGRVIGMLCAAMSPADAVGARPASPSFILLA